MTKCFDVLFVFIAHTYPNAIILKWKTVLFIKKYLFAFKWHNASSNHVNRSVNRILPEYNVHCYLWELVII